MLNRIKTSPFLKAGALAAGIAFAAGVFSGCGQGTNNNVVVPGVAGPHVTFINGTFTMSVVLSNVTINEGIRIPIPKMSNSYVEVGPDFQSAGSMINVGIDSKDLKTIVGPEINLLDPTALPGGRPLPGASAGQMPGLAVQVPNWDNVTFYFDPSILGVFVPASLPWTNYMATFRFFDTAGDQVGNLSVVGEDSAKKNSGLLVLIDLAGTAGQLMSGATPSPSPSPTPIPRVPTP